MKITIGTSGLSLIIISFFVLFCESHKYYKEYKEQLLIYSRTDPLPEERPKCPPIFYYSIAVIVLFVIACILPA